MTPFPTPQVLAELLPRYRLDQPPLSETEMSVVYRGTDTAMHDRGVAVKILSPRLNLMAGYRERFIREVRMVATLQHSNIIAIHEASTEEHAALLYLVMPFVDGRDLRHLSTHGPPLELTRVVRIVEQVAAALDFAHRRGVVHRDVKPGNILLTRDTDHVYLCDFGIAKETTADRRQVTRVPLGTPGFMAPELLSWTPPPEPPPLRDPFSSPIPDTFPGPFPDTFPGPFPGPDTPAGITEWDTWEPPAHDIQRELLVDVYALGAVLHQCLTGRPPFDRASTDEVVEAQLHREPPPVSALRPELPKALDEVVRRAMARVPTDRYPSCRELAEALRAAASGRPTGGGRPVGGARNASPPAAGTPPAPPATPSRTPPPAVPPPPLTSPPLTSPPRTSPDGPGGPAGWRRVGRVLNRHRRVALAASAVTMAVVAAFFVVPLLRGQGTDGPGDAELDRVPAALRQSCAPADPASGAPGAATVLTCGDPEQPVTFSLFDQSATMDRAYTAEVRRAEIGRGSGDCSVATGAEHRYPGAGTTTGRVLCYALDGTASVLWTDEEARTLARVSRRDADDRALHQTWAGWVRLPAFPTAAERELIDLVRLADCQRAAAGDHDAYRGVLAAVTCVTPGPEVSSVTYYRFAEREDVTHTYDREVAEVDAPSGVYCKEGSAPGFLGTARLDLRSVDVGALMCHPGPQNRPVLRWTLEPLRIMGEATGTDQEKLLEWWNGSYGFDPPLDALVKAVNEQTDPAFPTAAERALLDLVPERSRVNCMRPSPDQIADNIADVPANAALVCGPTRGASIVFYYRFDDAASLRGAFARNTDISGPDCTEQPPDFHGDAPYAEGGARGRLACGTNSNGRYLIWTETGQKVMGLAFGGGEAEMLLDWWRFEAGPRA